jgi:hypothetical protein
MSRTMTIELEEGLMRGAEWIAHSSRREVGDVLVDAIKASVPTFSARPTSLPITELGDDEILARMRQDMPAERDRRLSFLLDQQQARDLTAREKMELEDLMTEYQTLLVRSSEAVAEAGRRGILLHTPTN